MIGVKEDSCVVERDKGGERGWPIQTVRKEGGQYKPPNLYIFFPLTRSTSSLEPLIIMIAMHESMENLRNTHATLTAKADLNWVVDYPMIRSL